MGLRAVAFALLALAGTSTLAETPGAPLAYTVPVSAP